MSLLPERSDHNQTISTPSGEIISIRAFREIHDQIVKSSQKINKQFFDNLLLDINNIKNRSLAKVIIASLSGLPMQRLN